jgi:DNA-binding CsgD family transcriptional regulator
MPARRGQDQAGGAAPGARLTPREREIMNLIAAGLPNWQIAMHLIISEKTVKNHICNIYRRLEVSERKQAVARWLSS